MADKKNENEEDLLIEVKDHIDRERTTLFFKKYGAFLGYCAVGTVVFFGGYEGWKAYDTDMRQGLGDKFLAAVNSEKTIKTSEFSAESGFAQLAEMAEAGRLAADKKTEKAVAQYQKIWEAKRTDHAIAKLAKIKAAILMINGDNAETPAWLNSSDDKIFDSEFNELVAIHALENGNDEKAEKVFKALSENKLTTATVKNRADAFISEIN